MTISPRVPTINEILRTSESLNLGLSEEDALAFQEVMPGPLRALGRLDELTVIDARSRYPRDAGYRPSEAENPFNGWYWKTEIRGAESGPLAGERLAIKDNIAVGGVPMSSGSRSLEGFVPTKDATVVTRLLEAGATIAGKANCEDMSFSGSGHTCAYGPVRNPRKPSHSPGGSSNGSAVVVAAGDVKMALGSDQGGSVRIPAAWTGVVGLKPTYGLVPHNGCMVMDMTLDHVGPLADTVENAARVLSVIAGPHPRDPRQAEFRHMNLRTDYLTHLDGGVAGTRIGILEDGFGHEPWDDLGLLGSEPVVDDQVRAAVARLEDEGAAVSSISVPLHKDGLRIWLGIHVEGPAEIMRTGGVGSNWAGDYDVALAASLRRGMHGHGADLSPTVKLVRLVAAHLHSEYLGLYYAKAQNLRWALRDAYLSALETCDVLVLPTVPTRATPLPPSDCTIQEAIGAGLNMVNNTGQFDVAGLPAISVPCGAEEGLPIGLMIVGRPFEDDVVLRVARAVEQTSEVRL